MRDLILLGLLPLMLVAVAKRPFIALGMWIWTAMFFPNGWVYGAASVIRYNLVFTSFAIGGYLLSKDKHAVRWGPIGTLVFIFLFWTTMSTLTTIGISEVAWEFWSRFFKVVMLFAFVVLIMHKKLHIDFFLWCLVLSIGFYGGLSGLKFVASGGGHVIAGLHGHILGDRNDLALALVMMLPLCVYLLNEYGKSSVIAKLILSLSLVAMIVSVIGTQSRGGLIALLALGLYLFAKSNRKLVILFLIAVAVALSAALVTDEWLARMNTISNADEDASFMGRVVAWKLSTILALQHPIFGGGFKALETFSIWQSLSSQFHTLPYFYTGDAVPDTATAHAAHSIYFQVLGDHGFIALAVYVGILVTAFRTAGRVAKRAREQVAEPWIAPLATMLQLSIFAFGLGGAALSFAYFDLIFAIFGIVVVLDKKILPEKVRPLATP
ncbi:MAG TPA: putative O-glycosylation ligase, exosortase A system-associated [Noviherbaspirillum sp.]|nr:putative O-glycosylation ligase, exosortase A system-associated [Noviherbaspirillum sp.]